MHSDGRPRPRTSRPGPLDARRGDRASITPVRLPTVPLVAPNETQLGACTRDPDRWALKADEGAKELCRACPRRWLCAQEACRTPGAEGMWAGIFIPKSGRARQFALRQLRSLAERHGASVRKVG